MKTAMSWIFFWFTLAALASLEPIPFNLAYSLKSASWAHPFGYDIYGRDFLRVVLSASFISSIFSITVVFASFLSGLFLGMSLSLLPRPYQTYGLRALDALLAFPSLLFSLAYASISTVGWGTLIFTLMIGTLPFLIRMSYSFSNEVLTREFILAAQSLGANSYWLLSKHIAPTVLLNCSVKIPNLFAQALMIEATTSFLGIGAPIGKDTWGSLLAHGKDYLIEAPTLALESGIPLVLTILALQTISTYLVNFFTNLSELS